MRQFIHGTDQAFVTLERRARQACVTFQNQELPPGSTPAQARVGFEVDPASGEAILLVDRGVTYAGPDRGVHNWLATGEVRFISFEDLRRWLRDDLGRCYRSGSAEEITFPERSGASAPLAPNVLTDLATVREGLLVERTPRHIDETTLFNALVTHVRGQDDALRTVARRVARHDSRRVPRRPLTLFAIGPTGIGKTKTAEVLGLALQAVDSHPETYGFLRLDMPEYQERHRISQLLGAPQGYVGYGDGAQLVNALAANPRLVILFDEIEKAHPDVLRALMNAMDAGRLSTAVGRRELDCRSAIFFFTSNLAADGILSELDSRGGSGDPTIVDAVCRRHLTGLGVAPELVGRVASFLAFQSLSTDTWAEIAALAVVRVGEEYGLRIERVEPAVIVRMLARAGGADWGARPLEYVVDDLLGAAFVEAQNSGHGGAFAVHADSSFVCVPIQ